jgi:hypothetical protein
MDDLHDKLVSKDGWYTLWHTQKHHKIIHWIVLAMVVVIIGALTVENIRPDWLSGLNSKADLSTELVNFPNDKIAFIIGPQLKSGSPLNPHPWFDQVANQRGIFWGEAFPTVPPMKLSGTVSLNNGSTIVTGSGTKFLSEISVATLGATNPYFQSNHLTVPSGSAVIASVQSDTQLTLAAAWTNPTASGVVGSTHYNNNIDQYLFGNYYDEALIQYINYYRTGDTRYLNYARKIADSYWKMPHSDEGRNRNFDIANIPPRHASLGGLMLRAMDGRPEMWDWINYYTRYQFNVWVQNRVNNPELYYGIREGAYMLLYATELAKVLPDSYPTLNGGTATNGAATRAQYLADAENVAVNYYGRLQKCDGSWRWSSVDDEPHYINAQGVDEGRTIGLTQPFQVGLLIQALGDLYDLSTNNTVKNSVRAPFDPNQDPTNTANCPGTNGLKAQITSGVTNLHTKGPYRDFPSGYQNYYWHGYHYFYYGGTQAVPNRFANGSDPLTTTSSTAIYEQRASIQTILQAYGVASHVSGNSQYLTWGDQVFAAGYGMPGEEAGSDGIHVYADSTGEPKSYNEAYRASGRYLAYRLMGSGSNPPSGDIIPPTTSMVAPAAEATVSGNVTISATASDNVAVSRVDFLKDGSVFASDNTAPYSISWDTTQGTNGSHTLQSKAYDTAGNTSGSNVISVNVNNQTSPSGDTTSPTSSLNSPANGATVSGTVTISATASDNVGVDIVYFVIGDSVVGSDNAAPYTFIWDTTKYTNGSSPALWVRAWDASGNAGDSSRSIVTVNNLTVPPTTKSHLSLSSVSVSFSAVSGDPAPATKNVILSNTGSGTSSWRASIPTDLPWCHMTPMEAPTAGLVAGSSTTLTISMDQPSNAGTFSCPITITDINADNSPQSISVSYTVTPAPTPSATPSITSFSVSAKTATTVTIKWQTDQPTTGSIKYGLTKTGLSLEAQDTTLSTTHQLTLTGLSSKNTYYYQIMASNQNGSSSSIISSFRTKPR